MSEDSASSSQLVPQDWEAYGIIVVVVGLIHASYGLLGFESAVVAGLSIIGAGVYLQ